MPQDDDASGEAEIAAALARGQEADWNAALATSPVGDAVRLLTAIQRAGRFGDGRIEGALESSLMQAALLRTRRWCDEVPQG